MRVTLLLLLLPISAWAQSNAPCPLKLPFEIHLEITGTYLDTSYSTNPHDTSFGHTFPYQQSYFIRVDTQITNSRYTFENDSLSFSITDTLPHLSGNVITNYRVAMLFDTQIATITRLALEYREDSEGFNSINLHTWSLICDSLRYSADSIFDCVPNASILNDTSSLFNAGDVPPDYGYYSDMELLSGTAEISGASLPPQSVSQNIVSSNFSILTTENAIHCSFDRCSKPRSLELYTPIGAKAASIEIAPGQSEISIPHLPSGLYFAQLGSAVLKVAIP